MSFLKDSSEKGFSKLLEEKKVASVKTETLEHIEKVGSKIDILATDLLIRKKEHDKSKLLEPEFSIFKEYTPKLKEITYMSDEYKQCLKEMKPALDHHYSVSRHHPEHFENGFGDMTIVDVCEMLMDWWASSERHEDGDINKSIEMNQNRFGYSNDVKQMMLNTIKFYKS